MATNNQKKRLQIDHWQFFGRDPIVIRWKLVIIHIFYIISSRSVTNVIKSHCKMWQLFTMVQEKRGLLCVYRSVRTMHKLFVGNLTIKSSWVCLFSLLFVRESVSEQEKESLCLCTTFPSNSFHSFAQLSSTNTQCEERVWIYLVSQFVFFSLGFFSLSFVWIF